MEKDNGNWKINQILKVLLFVKFENNKIVRINDWKKITKLFYLDLGTNTWDKCGYVHHVYFKKLLHLINGNVLDPKKDYLILEWRR